LEGNATVLAVSAVERSLSAVVLAGGRNTRLGGLNKGLAFFQGIPLAVRVLRLLAGLFEEVILVTNQPEQYAPVAGSAVLAGDLFSGCGPLGGIHAGLHRAGSPAAFCVACDMPFLSADFIRRQSELFLERDCDILLPRVRKEIEPLHAIYRKTLLGDIERILTDGKGYSIRRLFPLVRTEYLDLEDRPEVLRMFTNINLPEELAALGGQP
jgi:molybdopterin-guanine dinucleotide biosynthesis protein A